MMQQLFIDGKLADLGDNTQVSFTIVSNLLKGAADFAGNRTLTVTLPATVHNRTIIRQAQVVQAGGDFPYTFHNVDYWRNGVQIVRGGLCRLMSATPAELQVAVVWGVRTAVDALLTSNNTLNDITTNAAIEFHAQPQVSTYADALTDEVFYAALDTIHHADENEYFRAHIVMGDKSWDASNLAPASSYLHPSVRMNWILAKLETMFGMTFDFGAAQDDIDTMIVPLISKIPNDITFNGGYKAGLRAPSYWGTMSGNFIQMKTVNNSAIIAEQDTDPVSGHLTCSTAFSGLAKIGLYLYIPKSELRLIAYPIYKPMYGYRLDITVAGSTQSIVFLPEDTTIMATTDINGSDNVSIYVDGYIPIKMEVGEWITVRITLIHNGTDDIDLPSAPDYEPGIRFMGGHMYISEIVGSLNEVQPTQQYPVEGNLPDIKPIDLVKFLAAVTGVFPVQASTADTLVMRPVTDVFDFSRAVDWSGRLLSITSRPVAKNKAYALDGWAQKNWFRWKEDDTVLGDYDGSIDVDDETIDVERDIITFPFAATDGNNVPMYKKEVNYGEVTETKYSSVEPRVMQMMEGGDGEAVAYFDMDMQRILTERYGHLLATMQRPVVITETIRISDVELSQMDETRAVYLKQHGAYFALLEMAVKQGGTADVKLLKLKKEE